MKKSVIIIGGGIAGLAAAKELATAGMSITVIEAQNRFGGRIRTVEHSGVPIELGAEFVHGLSRPLVAAIREAKLHMGPVLDHQQLFEKGHLKETEVWDKAEKILKRISGTGADTSFDEFLATQKGINEETRRITRHFVESFNAADANRISAQALLRAQRAADQMEGAKQFRITRGYGALADFLTQQIRRDGGELILGACVGQIAWEHKRAEVKWKRVGHVETRSADAAIITLPLGILKGDSVKFRPPLPEKVKIAKRLEVGNVVRLVFEFREGVAPGMGFVHAPEKEIPTWWNDPRGPLVVGWAGGPGRIPC